MWRCYDVDGGCDGGDDGDAGFECGGDSGVCKERDEHVWRCAWTRSQHTIANDSHIISSSSNHLQHDIHSEKHSAQAIL